MPAHRIVSAPRFLPCSLLLAGTALLPASHSQAQAPLPQPVAERVALCELYQHPGKYQGQLIQVYATISGAEFELDGLSSSEACPAHMRLKLEFPAETILDRMDIETRADANILRHRYHAHQIALVAGRFSAAYVRKGEQRLPVEGGSPQGYGLHHDFDGVIRLQSLTEFTVLPDTHK